MTQAQLEAFEEITSDGSRMTQAQKILWFIRTHTDGATINEIARGLDLRESSVSGRLTDLKAGSKPLIKAKVIGWNSGKPVYYTRVDQITKKNNTVWYSCVQKLEQQLSFRVTAPTSGAVNQR